MPTSNNSLVRAIGLGAGAGLVGGVAFGIIMALQGMLPMVGMLIGQANDLIGFGLHMVISAFIGATFGVIATRLPAGWVSFLISGGVYGIVWWVLGALILMPLGLGMSQMVFVIEQPQIISLIGHVIYGVLTGGTLKLLMQRT
jgi:hypothetical protein